MTLNRFLTNFVTFWLLYYHAASERGFLWNFKFWWSYRKCFECIFWIWCWIQLSFIKFYWLKLIQYDFLLLKNQIRKENSHSLLQGYYIMYSLIILLLIFFLLPNGIQLLICYTVWLSVVLFKYLSVWLSENSLCCNINGRINVYFCFLKFQLTTFIAWRQGTLNMLLQLVKYSFSLFIFKTHVFIYFRDLQLQTMFYKEQSFWFCKAYRQNFYCYSNYVIYSKYSYLSIFVHLLS